MKFEKLLTILNDFGPHQRKVLLLLCLPAITCCWHKFVWVFIGAIPPHRCRLPFELENATFDLSPDVRNMSIPWDGVRHRWHECKMLNASFGADYFAAGVPSDRQVYCRNRYVYDTSRYATSVPVTWNLVCDKMILPATTQSIFYIGVLLGSIGYGAMADKFGRLPALSVALASLSIGGLVGGVVPDYFSFTAMRMVVGGSASGVFIVAIVMGMEMVGPSRRVFVGSSFQYFFAFGYLLLALLASIIDDWQVLQVTISSVGLLFISYYWIIPESARWLLQSQKIEEAEKVIALIIKENGVTVPPGSFPSEQNGFFGGQVKVSRERFHVFHLFRSPNLRRKSLIIFFTWMVTSGVYYGLVQYTLDLGHNDYVNFVIVASTEILAYTAGLFCLDARGRRPVLCGSLLLGGSVLLVISLLTEESSHASIVCLAMIGKFGLAFAYNVIYIFSVEMFPTVVRCTGLGCSSAMARVGGIVSSYVLLLNAYWKPLPLIVFGVLSIAASFLAFLLPETTKKNLPETLSDAETTESSTDCDTIH